MALSDDQIEESVDFGTREIFSVLQASDVVTAHWSRLVVDLNRGPDQLDAKGVVALTDYHGRSVYRPDSRPSSRQVHDRLVRYYRPYHSRLEAALKNPAAMALIDCHSLNGIGPPDAPDPGQTRKDVILSNNGDSHGNAKPAKGPISCPARLLHLFKNAFEANGFSVALNAPYRGGYIVRHYGHRLLAERRFAIQIEMNQSLYIPDGATHPQREPLDRAAGQVRRALEQAAASIRMGVRV
jgi:N-formylglutamate amidohydrolase